MSQPYVGEIRIFAGNFAPAGWALCQGQILPISENETLFNLIGTTYGGDGQSTFALPDLSGRVPIHQGQDPGLSSYVIGQTGGEESVTLLTLQIPAHAHLPLGSSSNGTSVDPTNNFWAASPTRQFVPGASANTTMHASTLGSAGLSQPHDNMVPFLGLNFIISLFGIFPTPA